MLGVVIAEPHSWAVRERHEAAAAAVGWKGDVVDFPSVTRDCQASFHTPQPPTTPPIGGGASSAPNPPAPPPPTSTPPLHQ
jgi:hypothetical protein